jgi:hypothetical protein
VAVVPVLVVCATEREDTTIVARIIKKYFVFFIKFLLFY